MATFQYELAPAPEGQRARELWLQHAAGFVLFEDVRRYAIEKVDPKLPQKARAAALKAIDDALYGLMMVIDGVSGGVANANERVELEVTARWVRSRGARKEPERVELKLSEGDGMCMGYHGWLKDDFGEAPVARLRARLK